MLGVILDTHTFKAHNEQGSSGEIMNRKFLNAITVDKP